MLGPTYSGVTSTRKYDAHHSTSAFVGGIIYYAWYKKNVLDKVDSQMSLSYSTTADPYIQIEHAFAPGYDPALELATHHKKTNNSTVSAAIEDLELEDGPWTEHLRRKEQDILDRIIHGAETGHYFMLLGCKVCQVDDISNQYRLFTREMFVKGAGKTTMILDSMQANQAEGVAMCDAHPDLEVFRLRLGKALNYEYNEDSQTGLFQRRDPREGQHSAERYADEASDQHDIL